MRVARIELALKRWKRLVLPLHHTRKMEPSPRLGPRKRAFVSIHPDFQGRLRNEPGRNRWLRSSRPTKKTLHPVSECRVSVLSGRRAYFILSLPHSEPVRPYRSGCNYPDSGGREARTRTRYGTLAMFFARAFPSCGLTSIAGLRIARSLSGYGPDEATSPSLPR